MIECLSDKLKFCEGKVYGDRNELGSEVVSFIYFSVRTGDIWPKDYYQRNVWVVYGCTTRQTQL